MPKAGLCLGAMKSPVLKNTGPIEVISTDADHNSFLSVLDHVANRMEFTSIGYLMTACEPSPVITVSA